MDRNTAIVEIVLNAAEAIRTMALDAIDKLDDGVALHPDDMPIEQDGAWLSPEAAAEVTEAFNSAIDATVTQTSEYTSVATPASTTTETGEKKRRGRPRKADAVETETVLETAKVVVENAPEIEPEAAETEQMEDADEETVVGEEDTADESTGTTLAWVKENLEETRQAAREIASKHMAKSGVNAAREQIKKHTGKMNLTDATADDLFAYLSARGEIEG